MVASVIDVSTQSELNRWLEAHLLHQCLDYTENVLVSRMACRTLGQRGKQDRQGPCPSHRHKGKVDGKRFGQKGHEHGGLGPEEPGSFFELPGTVRMPKRKLTPGQVDQPERA